MANRNGEPPPTAKVQLTDIQRDRIERARQVLAAALWNEDFSPPSLAGHLGNVRHELSEMIALVGQLTGAPLDAHATRYSKCRECGAAITQGAAGGWYAVSRFEVLEDPCDHAPKPTGGAS